MVASERGSEAFANECLSSQYVMSILIPYESLVVYFLIPAVVYFLRYNTCSRLFSEVQYLQSSRFDDPQQLRSYQG